MTNDSRIKVTLAKIDRLTRIFIIVFKNILETYDIMHPVAKGLIKTKSSQNVENNFPVKSIKCFSHIKTLITRDDFSSSCSQPINQNFSYNLELEVFQSYRYTIIQRVSIRELGDIPKILRKIPPKTMRFR